MAAPLYFVDSTNSEGMFQYDIPTGKYKYRAPGQQSFQDITDPKAIKVAEQQLAAYQAAQPTQSLQVPPAAPAAPVAGTQAPLSATDAAALQDFNKFSQRRDLTRSLGPAALIGGIGAAAQLGQVIAPRRLGNIQDRYAAEELDRLQDLERRGQLGLTEGERGEMERQMMDPVRTMSRDIQRAGEAERASSGVVTSAASQVRADRERQRLIADQARQAGAQIAQADMAKADQQMRKMEQLIAYKGQRSQQAIANLQKTGMDIAYLAGLARAGKAMEQIDPQGLAQATKMDMDVAVAISKDLSRAQDFGGISEREIEKIIKDNGVSEAGAQFIRENYATQTQRGNLGDTLKQGRLTEAQQIERETGRMTPAGQPRQLSRAEQLDISISRKIKNNIDLDAEEIAYFDSLSQSDKNLLLGDF